MEYEEKRKELVKQIREEGIGNQVLEAMGKVPRHLFVSEDLKNSAYIDSPLPIGNRQTISAPHMVAIMCDVLNIEKGMKILEIGAGSGYNAAVMAEMVGKEGHIYSIERISFLKQFAEINLKNAGYANVTVIEGDGTLGYPPQAPYERICVTSAAPSIPQPLKEQLSAGGIMVIPVGKYMQNLILVHKLDGGTFTEGNLGSVIFVPLIGKYGYRESIE
ncbi:protein-L-isoaspartate O-methyltransferase [Methanohalophilus mahii]|uniref:Protein-L-isoaspartate O-methyltransferase n=1 Tax=Methanohalophilus mahii (strain ATCC 35705 / DSM 5219 / SLP) TaxID=547558 RepID=D5E871_METMS|nr:protein-L-isoaspartate O-methyltransferase [Methanohalophilus mahii]ADE37359.1 protein-L-isoaspartate O-methyltransferase [Methanohalophilus mahii DSM 5219]